MKKESNFVSAVVYLADENKNSEVFTKKILEALDCYFEHYELIIVNDCCKNQKSLMDELSCYAGQNMISMVQMSVKQGVEICLSAGLDVSIGDFVFEFDSTDVEIDKDMLWEVYQKALEGNDVVSVETKENSFSRKVFYGLFNKYSKSNYDINASLFRLVSRRAINRVLNLKISSAFRQAMYASCGLKNASIEFVGKARRQKSRGFDLAVESFLLYTNLPEKICTSSIKQIVVFSFFWIVGMILRFLFDFGWLDIVFGALIFMISVNVMIPLITILYYVRLIVKGTDSDYLIENIDKLQKR